MAISGGPDSIFMGTLFKEIENSYDLKLGIAYINHNLRNVKEEMEYVKNFAKERNIPFFYGEIFLNSKGSKEETLRILRLEKLKEIANLKGFSKIALGHTKDDQKETILMRFLKGTALRGLSGIKPVNEEIFIHPLLSFSKEEIIEFLKRKNINYFIDSTNYKNSFLRNKLRNLVIPFLEKEINPSFGENLIKMSEILKEDEDYIRKIAFEKLNKIYLGDVPFPKLDRNYFINLHPALQNRVLISILRNFNFRWEIKHIIELRDFIEKPNREAKFLNPHLTFITTYDNIFICPFQELRDVLYLKNQEQIFLPSWKSTIYFSEEEGDFCIEKNILKKIRITSILKEREFLKDLKRLKIPHPLRKYLPIFAMDLEILWIPGFYKKDLETKNKIYMRWCYGIKKNT